MRFLIPAVPVHVATTLCPVLFSNWGISSRTISFVAPVASIAMSAAPALEGETKRTAAAKTNAILIARPLLRPYCADDRASLQWALAGASRHRAADHGLVGLTTIFRGLC